MQSHYCTRRYENEPCEVCAHYEARRDALARGVVKPYYIIAVGVSRHYGGPEEGGWWYDSREILEVRKAYTLSDGIRHARELREEYPQPRYSRHSCANRGEPDTYIVTCYDTTDPRWPEETHGRPRYE